MLSLTEPGIEEGPASALNEPGGVFERVGKGLSLLGTCKPPVALNLPLGSMSNEVRLESKPLEAIPIRVEGEPEIGEPSLTEACLKGDSARLLFDWRLALMACAFIEDAMDADKIGTVQYIELSIAIGMKMID